MSYVDPFEMLCKTSALRAFAEAHAPVFTSVVGPTRHAAINRRLASKPYARPVATRAHATPPTTWPIAPVATYAVDPSPPGRTTLKWASPHNLSKAPPTKMLRATAASSPLRKHVELLLGQSVSETATAVALTQWISNPTNFNATPLHQTDATNSDKTGLKRVVREEAMPITEEPEDQHASEPEGEDDGEELVWNKEDEEAADAEEAAAIIKEAAVSRKRAKGEEAETCSDDTQGSDSDMGS